MQIKTKKDLQKLFSDLNKLDENPDVTFFRTDVTSSMQSKFAIFSYHIANYSDWLLPNALECRGIMFELDEEGNPIRVASRPMEKFFNYKENPFTEKLEDFLLVTTKEDGSLISTFLDKGELFVKSKGSLFSQQAIDAQRYLYSKENKNLYSALKEYAELGYTVNMEWVSPNNRIVVGYENESLVILNIRHNETGEYVQYNELLKDNHIAPYLVDVYNHYTVSSLLDEVQNMTGEEGYVVWKDNKPYCKLKCPWYVHLHLVKESVSSDKNLWLAVGRGTTDDIKSLFEADEQSIKRIESFELKYKNSFSKVYNRCLEVYNTLQGKARKDYAIEAQSILNSTGDNLLFSIVMKMFLEGMTDSIIDMISEHLGKYYEVYLEKSNGN